MRARSWGSPGVHDLDVDLGLFSLDEDGAPYVPLDDGPVIRASAAVVREQAGALGTLMDEAEIQVLEQAELAVGPGTDRGVGRPARRA